MLTIIDETNDTIQNLLLLSKVIGNSQKLESVSLSQIMNDLCELATTLGEDKKIEVKTDIEQNIKIKADKKLLQRAISNIIFNAVFYSKSNGTVVLNLKKKSNSIVVSVVDTGVGISKDDLPQVFSRFYRGKNADGKGSGLGLAISKAVIESLGGKITLTSSLHKGTSVFITLEKNTQSK